MQGHSENSYDHSIAHLCDFIYIILNKNHIDRVEFFVHFEDEIKV